MSRAPNCASMAGCGRCSFLVRVSVCPLRAICIRQSRSSVTGGRILEAVRGGVARPIAGGRSPHGGGYTRQPPAWLGRGRISLRKTGENGTLRPGKLRENLRKRSEAGQPLRKLEDRHVAATDRWPSCRTLNSDEAAQREDGRRVVPSQPTVGTVPCAGCTGQPCAGWRRSRGAAFSERPHDAASLRGRRSAPARSGATPAGPASRHSTRTCPRLQMRRATRNARPPPPAKRT